MTAINPRSITDEAPFLPESIDDLIDLRERVLAAGYSEPVAHGLVGWLVGKRAGSKDQTSPDTRARYRRILRELGEGGDDTGRAAPRPGPRPIDDAGGAARATRRPQTAGGGRSGLLAPITAESGPEASQARTTPIISERSVLSLWVVPNGTERGDLPRAA